MAVILSVALVACTPKAVTPSGNPSSTEENQKDQGKTTTDDPGKTDSGKNGDDSGKTDPGKAGDDSGKTDPEKTGDDSGKDDPGKDDSNKENGNSTEADNGQDDIEAKLANWKPDLTFSTSDFDMFDWDDTCFAYAKVTMINLWAYWCGPCVSELPEINRLSEEYSDKGFQVFGITYPEEEVDNREIVKELGLSYQMLFYTDDFDSYLDSGYLPTTIFVDGNGHVIGEPLIGSRSYEEWKELIEEYLAK